MNETALPDTPARRRVEEELDVNILLEAGAGSGKTTALLRRMLALIRSQRATVDKIAAVTFTRKAAAELRERFQMELERALAEVGGLEARDGGPVAEPRDQGEPNVFDALDAALRDIDRCFIGTIHSFCARLLRERPIEARLDPSFREVFGPEERRLQQRFWLRHLETLARSGDSSLQELARVNLRPQQLEHCFQTLSDHPDVFFPAAETDRPEVGSSKKELEALLGDAERLLPAEEPERGWDDLQGRIRQLRFSRYVLGWDNDANFFDALATVVGKGPGVTQNRWGEDPETKRAAKRLGERFEAFGSEGGEAHRALLQWYAYRYPIALRFAQHAADAYQQERWRTSQLNFNDLLLLAAQLLRSSPTARADLGQRFRYLLVDEFQDTDPVQAEVVMLLAAEYSDEDDWRRVVPRPGSLFVVGDPKQSIYRFRRADITVYNQVRERFREFGQVLTLTTNFRSLPPIERFVNGVFESVFPARPTLHQAEYAPLQVNQENAPPQGVFWYDLDPAAASAEAVAAEDAERLASWIAARIESGERKPGDFLVLAYRKQFLHSYAAALERRQVPVQATGAGIGVAEELGELLLVLRALATPDDPVLTLAMLTGLYFGLDYETLVAHKLAGHGFCFTESDGAADSVVGEALAKLHKWWQWTCSRPADEAVGAILDEIGLLPFTAAGELGESNAGAVLYILESIWAAGLTGDTSLRAALDLLADALSEEEVEAPLRPGRADVVRVMNLHKAKGLEATVVILAHPTGAPGIGPDKHIIRPHGSRPIGHMIIRDRGSSPLVKTVIAQPQGWPGQAATELPYAEAEVNRLLYVAATRAGAELVISRCHRTADKSPWKPFYAVFDTLAEQIDLPLVSAPERTVLPYVASEISEQVDATERGRLAASAKRYSVDPVTQLVKSRKLDPGSGDSGRGAAWGSAVHEALEAAGRGATGDNLREVCRTVLLEQELETDARGEPVRLQELVVLVETVLSQPTWQRARNAARCLVEVPFSVSSAGPEGPSDSEVVQVVDGVIDLVFHEPDGWVIVDYKSDVIEDPEELDARLLDYREQVELYSMCWQGLTGERVKERRILWLGMDLSDEVW